MKYLYKKALLFGLASSIALSMIGCSAMNQEISARSSATVSDSDKSPQVVEESTEDITFNKELALFLPNKVDSKYLYNGTVEYQQNLSVTEIKDETDTLTVKLSGNVVPMSAEGKKLDTDLSYTYVVNDNSILEKITNPTLTSSQSIIKELIILQGTIEEEQSWTQDVQIDSKSYNATTEITKLEKDDEGLSKIYTTLKVSDIEGYPDNVYTEYRVYKEGKGLYRFDKTILLDDNSPFEFGYTLYEGL